MGFSFFKLFSKKSTAKEASFETSSAMNLKDVQIDESIEVSEPIPVTILYALYVRPYEKVFKLSNTLDGIKQLTNYLYIFGDMPSIRRMENFQKINNPYGILAKTKLVDHSRRVTDNLLNLFQSTFGKNLLPYRPMLTILGLGHDIGKIPFFDYSEGYSTANHPIVSAQVVRQCFNGRDIPWLDKVENAILNHHSPSHGELDLLLKKADSMARDTELML